MYPISLVQSTRLTLVNVEKNMSSFPFFYLDCILMDMRVDEARVWQPECIAELDEQHQMGLWGSYVVFNFLFPI